MRRFLGITMDASYTSFGRAILVLLGLIQTLDSTLAEKNPPLSAETNESLVATPTSEDKLWNLFDFYGDLRLRYELDYDSVRADGITARDDRNRFRTRTRLGMRFEPTQSWLFDARVRHGDSNSQQSPHVTWIQDGGPHGEQSDFLVDRLYLAYRSDFLSVTLGRQGLPFWKPHELYWDDDVYLDGIAAGTRGNLGDGTWHAVAGIWALPDGPDNHAYDEKSLLTAGQIQFEQEFGKFGTLTIADGLLWVNDKSGIDNRTNDDVDFTINALDIHYQFNAGEVPVTLGGTYVHNFDSGPPNDSERHETDGYVLYGTLGDLSSKGDWLLGYFYANIEKYAVARFFAQDDWFRFGSPTQTRASNFRGHEIRLAHALTNDINLVLRAYFVDTISNREKGNRVRLDLNFRF